MRKLIAAIFAMVFLSACKNTWDSEARSLFLQGCLESAREAYMEETAAKSMCDCRLEKTMEKYPNFANAMNNLDKIMEDEEIKACK